MCVIDNISANLYESLNWHCTIILQFTFLSGYTASIVQIGRKVMLTAGGLLMALLNGISATLILSFNLEQEDNVVVSYIVVCLVCLFVLIFTGSW